MTKSIQNPAQNKKVRWGYSPETLQEGKTILVVKHNNGDLHIPNTCISQIEGNVVPVKIQELDYGLGHWFITVKKPDYPHKEVTITCTRNEIINYVD